MFNVDVQLNHQSNKFISQLYIDCFKRFRPTTTSDLSNWFEMQKIHYSDNAMLYLYLYTIFDQRRLDIIDQVEHGRSPQQVTHLPPVWDLLLPLA